MIYSMFKRTLKQQLWGDTSFGDKEPQIDINVYSELFLACISTPQLNSMHVETNESISASHYRQQTPIYSNTSQSALGMNTHLIMEYSHKRKHTGTELQFTCV